MRRVVTADEGSTGSKGTKIKVSAAVLVAAILMYFLMYFATRPPRAESPPQVADGELVDAADVTSVADPATEAVRRSPVAEEPPGGVSAVW